MPLGEQFRDVAALGRVHRVEAEVVEDEQVGGDQLAHLGVVAVVEARVLEHLQHGVDGDRDDAVAAPAGDVAERVSDERLPSAHRANDRDVRARLEEAQRRKLVQQRAIIGDLRSLVPALEDAVRLELGARRACLHGGAVSTRNLVAQHQEHEVLVRHLLRARQR
jgi:hypothetical protein